ncbi:amidase [Propioniciclava sp.]|uniref:amidase n=1 Tax=Propioniciclava sp. TaxID=2038686 RepID=UPI002618DECA|nr:amidase [Propioniciclava sp.]
MDAVALAAAVRAGQVSALEVTTEALARAVDLNPVVGAFASLAAEHACTQAAAVDAAVAAGTLGRAPLAGVPLPIKDLVEVAGLPFEGGSEVMAGHVGVATDVVAGRLIEAGSITLGKTSTPEFGFPCYTEPDSLPPAVTPWDTTRMAGGSSGGAAAAVASGIVPMAHASDGGGSIRIPAACCGLVGLKPSRGLVNTLPSRVPGPGLVTDGVLTTTVRDSALGLDVLAPGHGFLAVLAEAPAGLRIGVTDVPVISETAEVHRACRAAVAEVADVLSDLGHAVVPAPRAFPAGRWAAFDAVWATGAASLPLPPEAEEDLTPLTSWLRRRGQAVSAAEYAAALGEIQRLTWDVEQAWAGLDIVVTPTLAQPPLPVGALRDDDDPAADFAAQVDFTPWTSVANLTGRPSLSLPLVRADVEGVELPIGVMFTGRRGGDALLLRLAAVLEDTLPWPRTVRPRAGFGAA